MAMRGPRPGHPFLGHSPSGVRRTRGDRNTANPVPIRPRNGSSYLTYLLSCFYRTFAVPLHSLPHERRMPVSGDGKIWRGHCHAESRPPSCWAGEAKPGCRRQASLFAVSCEKRNGEKVEEEFFPPPLVLPLLPLPLNLREACGRGVVGERIPPASRSYSGENSYLV